MSKTKQPKRLKVWLNQYDWGIAVPRESIKGAKEHAELQGGALRVAVPLIELRRGEVVVDVEALLEAIDEESSRSFRSIGDDIRAAIKKVGVR